MATNKESRKEYWKRKWLSKYRLVVMDDSTYEEKTSFRLSRLNIFVYTAVENKRETLNLLFRVDSLEGKMQSNDEYLASLKKVLVGNIKPQQDKDTTSFNISNPKYDPKAYRTTPTKKDSILRKEVEEEETQPQPQDSL